MKKMTLLSLLCCLILSAGCTATAELSVTKAPAEAPAETATEEPAEVSTEAPTMHCCEPTVETATSISATPAETPTELPLPPVETPVDAQPTLESAVVGFQGANRAVLYFDPTRWSAKAHDFYSNIMRLESKEISGCVLQQLLGRGYDPVQTPMTFYNLNFNGIPITYRVWRNKDTQLPVLAGYYWDNESKSLEVLVEESPEECLEAAQKVVMESAEFNFTR